VIAVDSTIICVECRTAFTHHQVKQGRPPTFCSDKCRTKHLRRNWRESKRRHARELDATQADSAAVEDDEDYDYDTGNYIWDVVV
jgi:endogenous inhibitor of DNA gyrase (YacG/DUF329 family)